MLVSLLMCFAYDVQIPTRLTLGAHHQSMGPESLCNNYFTNL
jgi:hypothetical protein